MTSEGMTPQAIKSLTALGVLAGKRIILEADIGAWVDLSREQGASWRMIGVALGTTGQAAWQRYSGQQRDSEIPGQAPLPITLDET